MNETQFLSQLKTADLFEGARRIFYCDVAGKNLITYDEGKSLSRRNKPIIYFVNENGCWICVSLSPRKKNYGGFAIKRGNVKNYAVHKYIYEREKGHVPAGLLLRHICDNGHCINPDHLLIGTYKDNYNDSVIRDRNTYGERMGTSKLKSDQIEEIVSMLRAGVIEVDIAKKFGVCRTTINDIRHGKKWKRAIKNAIEGENFIRRGGNACNARIKEQDAISILKRILSGEKQSNLAREYGVSTGLIQALWKGRTWKHIPRPRPNE